MTRCVHGAQRIALGRGRARQRKLFVSHVSIGYVSLVGVYPVSVGCAVETHMRVEDVLNRRPDVQTSLVLRLRTTRVVL